MTTTTIPRASELEALIDASIDVRRAIQFVGLEEVPIVRLHFRTDAEADAFFDLINKRKRP